MAVLTVASNANGALILPATLAAAHVTQSNPHDGIVIEYKDVVSLGKGNEKVILTTKFSSFIRLTNGWIALRILRFLTYVLTLLATH